ncbi:hypothetical protein [Flavobacterium sp.]|uniref:hypothetical protein n=1 Tax=Flavobacterium sp. TaxID=239 RepID=UPI0039E26D8D
MKKETREFQTFHFLEGLEMSENRIFLPHFTLLHFKDWNEFILKEATDTQKEMLSSALNRVNPDSIVLNFKVQSENYETAIEQSRVLCERFEHLMHFIIADINFFYSVGTKDIRRFQTTTIVTLDENGLGFGNKTHTFHQNYKVNSEVINYKPYGYDKLWALIGQQNLSPLNKKIVVAIEWIGKALWERDYTKSFIQMMIAFEVLLQHQSNALVSSSIANQISEWGAFIFSEKKEIRLKTYKKIKELYALRSKVVHSGFNEVNADNLFDALSLIKNIIVNLVINEEYHEISTESLSNKIIEKKFN